MQTKTGKYDTQYITDLLEQVRDPELPVLSIIELAILREVKYNGDQLEVVITPTYSGCPAMDVISFEIKSLLLQQGIQNFKVTLNLSPAWTTDWMTHAAKDKLKAYGIAPPTPGQSVCHVELFHQEEAIQCPLCNSYNTTQISRFGSTACKAMYRCNDCAEPFDYFKCH